MHSNLQMWHMSWNGVLFQFNNAFFIRVSHIFCFSSFISTFRTDNSNGKAIEIGMTNAREKKNANFNRHRKKLTQFSNQIKYDDVFGIRRMLLIEFVIDLARVEWTRRVWIMSWIEIFIGCQAIVKMNISMDFLNASVDLTSQTGHFCHLISCQLFTFISNDTKCFLAEWAQVLGNHLQKIEVYPKIDRTERSLHYYIPINRQPAF